MCFRWSKTSGPRRCWVGPSRKAGRVSGGSICEDGLLPVTGATGARGSSSDSVSDPSEHRVIPTGCLWYGWGIIPGAIADRMSCH